MTKVTIIGEEPKEGKKPIDYKPLKNQENVKSKSRRTNN